MDLKLVFILVLTISTKLSYTKRSNCKNRLEIEQRLEKGQLKHYAYLKGSSNWAASAIYDAYYNITGWDVFETETNPDFTDEQQAFAAGYLEGFLTWKAIHNHYYNVINVISKSAKEFLDKNTNWVEKMIKKNDKKSSIWHQVNLVYKQIQGICSGYNEASDSDKRLSYKEILRLNFLMDLITPGLYNVNNKNLTHCSAIIKLLPNNSDIVFGHATWTGYNFMVRMLKKYNHHYHTSATSTMEVSGVSMAFSGYPGTVSSIDDFYIMNSKLAAMETTISFSNEKLVRLITPESVLEAARSLVANRLAYNGRCWGKYFSRYNSGTYNNQWMILDLNKFTPGFKPELGLLYIIEQIPGYVRMEDQTLFFLNQTYWASYNSPFYEDILNMSGIQWNQNSYSRAMIFKRDHSRVTDVDTVLTLLRSNDYKHDPYSVCKECNPPYDATLAISARGDLNPAKVCFGATDAKVSSSKWASSTQFKAVNGPTTGSGLPVFKWSTIKSDCPHHGQPDSFEFDPVIIKWSYNN